MPAWMYAGLGVAIIVAAIVVTVAVTSYNPIPSSIRNQVSYALYYPSQLYPGYRLQSGSVRLDHGIVFFTLTGGVGPVIVSEQAVPSSPPNLSLLAGFTSLPTVAGKAVTGTNSTNQPMSIILSNTTLIIITGHVKVPSDVISTLAQNMRSLPQ